MGFSLANIITEACDCIKIVGETLFRLKLEAFCNWLQEKNHRTDQFQMIAARINCTSEEIFALINSMSFMIFS